MKRHMGPAVLATLSLTAGILYGQTAQSEPDVLIFSNGEKLIGHLISATGSLVVFKSEMAGEIKVDWSKIQDLRSSQKFAAIPKDVVLRSAGEAGRVPQGTVAMTGQKIEINSGTGGAAHA